MNPTVMSNPNVRRGNYNVVPYQSTHNTGGTITGTEPEDQCRQPLSPGREADNLFVMGASVFPQNASYNPTGPVGALAYYSADAIVGRYLKSPGPLVPRDLIGRVRKGGQCVPNKARCAVPPCAP